MQPAGSTASELPAFLDFGTPTDLYGKDSLGFSDHTLLAQLETSILPEISFQNSPAIRAADVIVRDTSGSGFHQDQALAKAGILPDSATLLKSLQDAEASHKQDVIAWDPRDLDPRPAIKHAAQKASKQAHSVGKQAERYGSYGKETATNQELRKTEPDAGQFWHPHRGQEDNFISYGACAAANRPFENLRLRSGPGPGHIDPDLIAAMMRNEQFFYKQFGDTGTDNYVRNHGNLDILHNSDTYSIGPAQMQIRNIQSLVKQFPEQLGQYSNDPLRAALNPGDAPMFVAAYMSNMVGHLETGKNPGFSDGVWKNIQKHWQSGDANGAMILAFNPDSHQIENVNKQLDIIKEARAKQQKNGH
ncbi:MAG: hypothetical protein ACRDHZ_06670 [Ktedonobacteraceae bacterium]